MLAAALSLALASAPPVRATPTAQAVAVDPPPGALATVRASAVSAGSFFTCALVEDGTVRCWGFGSNGQLGNSSTANSALAVPVSGLTAVSTIVSGQSSTCALFSGGMVDCWGEGGNGRLGNGGTADALVPVRVAGVSGATGIGSGPRHACAVVSGGAVRCWGSNGSGQLGDGTKTDRTTPVLVPGLNGVVAITGGYSHTCALRGSGEVACWGANFEGELGNGSATSSLVPVEVADIADAVAIASGESHTCAIVGGGAVKCWGSNLFGQLGDGTNTARLLPQMVPGLTGVASIAASSNHTCALLSSGGVRCWGDNRDGALGNGKTDESNVPVTVLELSSGIAALGLGETHGCVVLTGGGVKCWGSNTDGELGNGTTNSGSRPVSVASLMNATAIAGENQPCVRTSSGGVRCWGYNHNGQLGNGLTDPSSVPVGVSGITTATGVAAGGSHACAIVSGGQVQCWGRNDWGQLATYAILESHTPITVPGLVGATAISAGLAHTCVIVANGAVKCWGLNEAGELGTGTTMNTSHPTEVVGLSGATSISAGPFHTCAIVAGGAVKCWGATGVSTLDGNVPVAVPGISGATRIATGYNSSCALVPGALVKCWGWNSFGQLGDGTTINRSTPVTVSGVAGATAIGAGGTHACAVVMAGTVKCWGSNDAGELGTGDTQVHRGTVTVEGISGATAIAALDEETCVIFAGGLVRCWGGGGSGRLGDGRFLGRPVSTWGFGNPGLPGAPIGPVAVAGAYSATVYWDAPGDDGGTRVASYTVTSTPGGRQCTLTSGLLSCTVFGLTLGQAYTFKVVARNAAGLGPVSGPSNSVTPRGFPSGSTTYHPIPPVRLLDTRASPANGYYGRLTAGVPVSFRVAGRGGVSDVAIAVTGNLTVTGATAGWAVYLGPAPLASPTTSTINFAAGQTIANGLTVTLSSQETLSATYMGPAGATTDLVFDVSGYYTAGATGQTYHPIAPARDVDTRKGLGLPSKLSASTPACFTIAGLNGVSSGAAAVTGNVTVANPSAAWALYLGPSPVAAPTTSTLNFAAGQVASNNVTVALGTGKLCATYLGPPGATTDLVFDVTGFYTADTTGAAFVPAGPARLLDTRFGNGLSGRFVAGVPRTFGVVGRAWIPPGALAVTGNLTVTDQTSSWAIYLGPAPLASPSTSSLNFVAGEVKANGVTVALSPSGTLSATYLGPAGATTNLLFDVTGYFTR